MIIEVSIASTIMLWKEAAAENELFRPLSPKIQLFCLVRAFKWLNFNPTVRQFVSTTTSMLCMKKLSVFSKNGSYSNDESYIDEHTL